MKRSTQIAFAAAAVFLALGGSANAVQLVTPDGRVAQPYQYWANASRAPTPQTTITVVDSQCPTREVDGGPPATIFNGYPLACYSSDTETIYSPAGSLDFVFFHELGHAFDFTTMSGAAHAGFAKIVGDGGWDPEDFADRYAFCSQNGPWPVHSERFVQRRVCALIRRVGRRAFHSGMTRKRGV